MSPSAAKTALPLWLLILIVGIIVGVSMGRAQSMGLYLPPVTQALGIGREPFGAGDGAGAAADGRRRAVLRRPDRQVRRRPRSSSSACSPPSPGSTSCMPPPRPTDLLISGVLMGIGVSGTGVTSLVGTIGRLAPPEKRLSAIASIGMAAGIGGFVALPVMHFLIEMVGWQAEPALADGDHGAAHPAGLADRRQAGGAERAGARRRRCKRGAARGLHAIRASGC